MGAALRSVLGLIVGSTAKERWPLSGTGMCGCNYIIHQAGFSILGTGMGRTVLRSMAIVLRVQSTGTAAKARLMWLGR